jgi:hypothetical protein
MIEARHKGTWSGHYDLVADGVPLATFDRAVWRAGGAVEVGGRHYRVQSNLWMSSYTLLDEAGATVASAQRVGRKDWSVDAGGTAYAFRRVSAWRQEEELLVDGQRAGSVRRTSMWRGDAVADLSGLPPVVAVFVVAVVLTAWDLAASTG